MNLCAPKLRGVPLLDRCSYDNQRPLSFAGLICTFYLQL